VREPNLFFSLLESVTPRHAGCELCRLILCLFESPPQDFACFVYYYGVWRDGTHSEWAAPTQHRRAPQDPLHSSPAPRREKKKQPGSITYKEDDMTAQVAAFFYTEEAE
jgi:hypothetical protein